ncbi:oxidoreductase [Chitinophaga sp. SYP-B3965]|uniref:WD40/YVTN/BNR-like repeat-containing protein n=1 Tax=Chitinophaga sp. SYP-B3965 TaxID=2663120 RepID=UPI001299C30F|nr:YCF48-related protein [Chitinophaga sp. SYP-B3965]MRG44042.1 oxidoreductase [Chitinophaga sp. SYP-B3965]
MKLTILLFILLTGTTTYAQPRVLTTAPINSIRGLSVVTDSLVWVSGTQGKAGRSMDAGATWEWYSIPGCDTVDFRDIEAFSKDRAVIVSSGEPARIYLTKDGGKNWKQTYYNDTKGIFLDAMDFWNDREGVIIGDPINDTFTILRTGNGGESWEPMPGPKALPGEACFAASGTTLRALKGKDFAFASGGAVSRFFRYNGKAWYLRAWPATQGLSTTGIFSFAFRDGSNGVAVGGDYQDVKQENRNCLITKDGGRTWTAPALAPKGYRTSVEYLDAKRLIVTGPFGTELSEDGGNTWLPLGNDPQGYHVARKAKKGTAVYFAGGKGRIAVLDIK